jgi:hypothetical protein
VEFEFLPTLLSGTGNYGTAPSGKICIYVKYAGAATIQIYNAFGKKMYEQVLIAYYDKAFLPGNSFKGTTPDYLDITETASFQRGVYIVVVSVEGQSKSKKFLKT